MALRTLCVGYGPAIRERTDRRGDLDEASERSARWSLADPRDRVRLRARGRLGASRARRRLGLPHAGRDRGLLGSDERRIRSRTRAVAFSRAPRRLARPRQRSGADSGHERNLAGQPSARGSAQHGGGGEPSGHCRSRPSISPTWSSPRNSRTRPCTACCTSPGSTRAKLTTEDRWRSSSSCAVCSARRTRRSSCRPGAGSSTRRYFERSNENGAVAPRKAGAPAGEPGSGVDDGIRTRDPRNHNPLLYQLSYIHQTRKRGPILEGSNGARHGLRGR